MRTAFVIYSQSTNQSPSPEITFVDRLATDYSTYGDPEATAIAAVLAAHSSYSPVIKSTQSVGEVGLPGYNATLSDVDAVMGGNTDAYFYQVLTKRPNGEFLTGTVVVKGKVRDSGASTWSSTTTYFFGFAVLYSGHNYVAISNPGTNLNKQPDTNPDYWQFDDISPAENAVDAGITQAFDPAWSSSTTYASGSYVTDTSGGRTQTYQSLQDSNLNNAPSTSPSWWNGVSNPTGAGLLWLMDGALTL